MKKVDTHVHAIPDDPNMDGYVSIMDQHNVVAALVHAMPGDGVGNEDVLRAIKTHPGRLFGSVHVDLREPVQECIDLVNEYADYGFRSIKLFPNLGFDPNDESFEPFWQVVGERKLLCQSHCGWLGNYDNWVGMRLHSLTACPFNFEIPARLHPEINFIFAHFGGGATYLQTVVLLGRLPNVFADTCRGWGVWVFRNRMPGLDEVDFGKVLYGTDTLGQEYTTDEAWWTKTLVSMGRTQEELDMYFYENGAKLLGIA